MTKTNQLKKVLSILDRIVPSRPTNPLHAYMEVETRQQEGRKEMVLRASNGEMDLELALRAEESLDLGGPFLLPVAPFSALVSALPEGEVALERQGAVLEVKAGGFRAEVRLVEEESYSSFTSRLPEGPGNIRLPSLPLREAIQRVAYAADRAAIQRGAFRGIQLEGGVGGALRAVASDGYRLAVHDRPLPVPFPGAKILIPYDLAQGLLRFLAEAEEVELWLGKGNLALAGEGEHFAFRVGVALMEGSLPDYEKVIPTSFVTVSKVETALLKGALRRLSALEDPQVKRVDLRLEEGLLRLSTKGDYGEGEEALPAQVEGGPLEVAVNSRYLLEALEALEGAKAVLSFSGPTTPLTVTAEGEGETKTLGVIVPLRV